MTGNGTIDKILAGLNLAVILGALGLVIKANFLTSPPAIDPAAEELALENEIRSGKDIKLFKMDKLIVNLPSRNKRLRYLDLEVHLRPFKNSQLKMIEDHKAKISDAIIDVVGRMTPRELGTLAGKILLEQKLKNRINSFYSFPTIEKIFYSKFVID